MRLSTRRVCCHAVVESGAMNVMRLYRLGTLLYHLHWKGERLSHERSERAARL